MKFLLLFLSLWVIVSASAQNADSTKTVGIAKSDSMFQRTYKVDMMSQQKDTVKAAPRFLQPHQEKPLESNYQYNSEGKVSGGSTKLKLGKKKKN